MLRVLRICALVGLLGALALWPSLAAAHQTITAGAFAVEYGWLNEPAITGQPNAIVLNISKQADAEPAASQIRLETPADGAQVQGDQVTVTVAFDGLPADANGAGIHWHLAVDDQLLSMVPLEQTTIVLKGLGNGSHTVAASLVLGDHSQTGAAATATINVTGGSATDMPSVAQVTAAPSHSHASTTYTDVDVSGLRVEIVYGGETKVLALQPLGENTPGQFIGPLTPTRAGQMTLRLSGKVDDTDINVEVQPEAVQTGELVEFPELSAAEAASASNAFGLTGWLSLAGLIFGLLGTLLGGAALLRKR